MWVRARIPMLNKQKTVTTGEVLKFYESGPWAVTLPAGVGRGFVVTHLPSGAFALPFGAGGDLDFGTAQRVVDLLQRRVGHGGELNQRDLREVRQVVEQFNELKWEP